MDADDLGEYQHLINGLLTEEERKAMEAKNAAKSSRRPPAPPLPLMWTRLPPLAAEDREEAIKDKAAAALDMFATQEGSPSVGALR